MSKGLDGHPASGGWKLASAWLLFDGPKWVNRVGLTMSEPLPLYPS